MLRELLARRGRLGIIGWCFCCLGVGLAQQSDAVLPGLVATYRDADHEVRSVVAAPHFYLDAEESLHPSLASSFEAEWVGLLSVLRAGEYSLRSAGAEIHLNHERHEGPVRLTPGRYPLVIKYRRTSGSARLRLTWEAEHFPEEPVPGSALFHLKTKEPDGADALVEQGRALAEEFGCVNCHDAGSSSLEARRGPDLSHLADRIQEAWVLPWLDDPQAFRAGARMPVMLDQDERRDVARYLVSLRDVDSAGRRRRADSVEIYDGHDLYTSVGCTACHGDGGVALGGIASKWKLPALVDYLREPASVDRSGRMPAMLDGEEAAMVGAYLMDRRKTTGAVNPAFEEPWTGGDAVNGKRLVESEGCLACHALRDPEPLENRHLALALPELDSRKGCLGEQVSADVPRFTFKADERQALAAFVDSYREHPDRSAAPIHELDRDLRRFGCVMCHESDHVGPLGALAERAPVLTGVGSKLKTDWLRGVLNDGERAHDWLTLRMPDYDAAQTSGMADTFAKVAGLAPGGGDASPVSGEAVVSRGHGLLGTSPETGGMGCIGCHDWGENRSLGEHGPQLVSVGARLRYDWYVRWMRDPSRILSGTSMSNYFSSAPPDKAAETIDALWAAFEKGDELSTPEGFELKAGLAGSERRPTPTDEAIVMRVDMPEASPAPIAVGMPGGVSYCFDTVSCRVRYAWRGEFLDASPTVLRKVEEGTKRSSVATILGEVFYRSDNFPLRVGTFDGVPGCDYRGYRIVDGYPEFHYRLDGVDIHERIEGAPDGNSFARRFRLPDVRRPMWFVVEEPAGVDVTSTLGTIRDGRWNIPQTKDVEFTVTVGVEGAQ